MFGLQGFGHPPKPTPTNVETAVNIQMGKQKSTYTPTSEEIAIVVDGLPTWRLSHQFLDWSTEGVTNLVTRMITLVKRDSSPGFPYMLEYATNRALLDEQHDRIVKLAVHRLLKLSDAIYSDLDSFEPYKQGLRDLVRPFMKTEPHPERKRVTGAYRIISGVSIVDQLVERVIFYCFSQMIKNNYPKLDMLIGIGFTDDMVAEIYQKVHAMPGQKYSSDISGWDSSIQEDLQRAFKDIVIDSCENPCKPWLNAITNWLTLNVHAHFVLPNGHIVKPKHPGMILSGGYITTIMNSTLRVLCSVNCSSTAYVMGDDCIECSDLSEKELTANYTSKGFVVRDVVKVESDSFSFCSHTYTRDNGAALESYKKALYKLFSHKKRDTQRLRAILYEMRHNSSELLADVESLYYEIYPALGVNSGKEDYQVTNQSMTSKSKTKKKVKKSPLDKLPRSVENISKRSNAKRQVVESVCAVTDPFCPAASGARWADKSAVGTATMQSRMIITLATGTNGYGALLFFPSCTKYFFQQYALTSGTLTPTTLTGEAGSTSAFFSYCDTVRVVSAGLRCWDIAASTAIGGSIVITEYPNFKAVENIPLNVASSGQGIKTTFMDRRKEVSFVTKPSNDNAYDFSDTNENPGTGGDNCRTGCLLTVSGAASNSVLAIEVVINYEGNLIAATAIQGTTAKPKQKSVQAVNAVSLKTDESFPSVIQGSAERVGSVIKQAAWSALEEVASEAAESILSFMI